MSLTRALLKKLLPRVRRYLRVNVVLVVRRPLALAQRMLPTRPGLECRVLGEAEALAFAADPHLDLSERWVHEAYARECLCLGALVNGQLLGYTWLAFGATPLEDAVWIRFDERLRYSHKSFVRPECRGERIMQALHSLADSPELRRGRHFTVAVINADNEASLVAMARSGSRPIGFAVYARGCGAVLVYRSRGLKRAGIMLCKPETPDTRVASACSGALFNRP